MPKKYEASFAAFSTLVIAYQPVAVACERLEQLAEEVGRD